jgi:O-antigen ligase
METLGAAQTASPDSDADTRAPFVGLLVYLGFDFLRPQDVFLQLRPWHPMLVVGVTTLLVTLWRRRHRLREGVTPLLPFTVLLGVAALSTLLGVDPARSARALVDVAKMLALVWLLLVLVSNQSRLGAALWVITLSLGVLATAAIVQGVDAGLMSEFRIEAVVQGPPGNHDGPFRDNNNLARVLAASVPLWWFLFRRGQRAWQRALAALGLLAAVVAIEYTFSRSGFLALVVGLVVLASSSRPRWHGFAALLAAASAVVLLTPRPYLERLATVGAPLGEESVKGRLEIWHGAAGAMVERPLLGRGPGTFERAEPGSGVVPRSSHNVFVEMMVELGALGLAAYVWMLVAVLHGLHVARRGAAPALRLGTFALEAAILAYLTASLALSSPFQSPLFVLLGVALALRNIASDGPPSRPA